MINYVTGDQSEPGYRGDLGPVLEGSLHASVQPGGRGLRRHQRNRCVSLTLFSFFLSSLFLPFSLTFCVCIFCLSLSLMLSLFGFSLSISVFIYISHTHAISLTPLSLSFFSEPAIYVRRYILYSSLTLLLVGQGTGPVDGTVRPSPVQAV